MADPHNPVVAEAKRREKLVAPFKTHWQRALKNLTLKSLINEQMSIQLSGNSQPVAFTTNSNLIIQVESPIIGNQLRHLQNSLILELNTLQPNKVSRLTLQTRPVNSPKNSPTTPVVSETNHPTQSKFRDLYKSLDQND